MRRRSSTPTAAPATPRPTSRAPTRRARAALRAAARPRDSSSSCRASSAPGRDGEVVTLGRGGSDLTATVLARALDANEVTLWKDVAGCMTADPRLVPDARVVPLLDAREASELAYYGAKVLHPRTLVPLRRARIAPHPAVRRSRAGRHDDRAPASRRRLAGARALGDPQAGARHRQGNGMIGVPGVAARTFGALARDRASRCR